MYMKYDEAEKLSDFAFNHWHFGKDISGSAVRVQTAVGDWRSKKKGLGFSPNPLIFLVAGPGFEPGTFGL